MLHNYKPNRETLDEWLKPTSVKGTSSPKCGHLLLEQTGDITPEVEKLLKSYFESALIDARTQFHEFVGIDLFPEENENEEAVEYPQCLPPKCQTGIFGEVLLGLITECYTADYVESHPWSIPIFLFRQHEDIKFYMFDLHQDECNGRRVKMEEDIYNIGCKPAPLG